MHQRHPPAEPIQAGDGGAHAGEVGFFGDDRADGFADRIDGIGQCVEQFSTRGWMDVEVGHGGHRHGGGEFTGGMPTHAVGHE